MNHIKEFFKKFNEDENGDAMQTILILLLAAIIILGLVKVLMPQIWDGIVERVNDILGTTI
jgi:hypothetical protein